MPDQKKIADTGNDSEGRLLRADTVPPPEGGDAYSAETVVRQAPPQVLESIRNRRMAERIAAIPRPAPLPKLAVSGTVPTYPPEGDPIPPPRVEQSSEPDIPRFNVDEGDSEAALWEAPPAIADVVREQRHSVRPESGTRSRPVGALSPDQVQAGTATSLAAPREAGAEEEPTTLWHGGEWRSPLEPANAMSAQLWVVAVVVLTVLALVVWGLVLLR